MSPLRTSNFAIFIAQNEIAVLQIERVVVDLIDL